MSKFIPRMTAPTKDNKFYYKDNIFQKCGYGLPNCTAYAWGRWFEATGLYPKLCTKNAENWFNWKDGYARGQKPKLGAIGVWAKGKIGVSEDGAGHVAYVEEIDENLAINTSNSAHGGTLFYMKKINPPYQLAGYNFLGFIYPPVDFEEDKPEPVIPTPTPTPSKTVDELAKEVINGKWGNGDDRKKRLTNAGYDYNAVQKRVNEILKGSTPSTPTFKVGDKVVPTRLVNYSGTKLIQYDKSYVITKITGDRIVLAANRNGKLITWAAMNIKDIKKV